MPFGAWFSQGTSRYAHQHTKNHRGLTIVGPIQSQSSRSGGEGLNTSEYDRDSDKMQHLQHFAGKMGARQQQNDVYHDTFGAGEINFNDEPVNDANHDHRQHQYSDTSNRNNRQSLKSRKKTSDYGK